MVTTGGWALWWGTPVALASCWWEALPDPASLMACGPQNPCASVSTHWLQWLKGFTTPYEPFYLITWFLSTCLLGMCQRGRIEINEKELNGTCSSTCTNKSYFGPPKQGCTRIDNCKKKETGWKRFFAQCVPCICDCALSCRESFPQKPVKHKWRTSWTDVHAKNISVFLFLAPAL